MVYQPSTVVENVEGKKGTENYIPKMKPGDVEIPNRVFVKGFPREATADDLFTFFEEFGQVLECRIVADKNGYSKGYGFVTFDSQNVSEKVKEMERINYTDDVTLVIGPARIRKKKYYLLPATPQYMPAPQQQQIYTPDGNVVWTTTLPQCQSQAPTMMQPTQIYHQSAVPMPMQPTMMPAHHQGYHPTPVILVNDSPPKKQQQQQQQCVTFQTASPNMNFVEKVPMSNMTTICEDAQQVPSISPVQNNNGQHVQQQPTNVSETIVYSHMVPMTTQKRLG